MFKLVFVSLLISIVCTSPGICTTYFCKKFYIFFIFSIVKKSEEDASVEKLRKAMENPDLFEGDIMIPKTRNAVPLDFQRWPDGVVPYVIDPSVNEAKGNIEKAVQHYSQNTCIRWVPRTNQNDYVRFFKGNGCHSLVGRVGNEQKISLGEGCNWFATAVHEMMHAIGFDHEQNRSDRDDYIEIHWKNIPKESQHNFEKRQPNQNRLYTSFDFESVMLYNTTAFSRNHQVTMSSKLPQIELKNHPINMGLSRKDIIKIQKLYQCK